MDGKNFSSEASLAVVAKAFGYHGTILLSVIALFATTNTVLMMLVSGSRIIFGMARENSIPIIFSKIQKNTRTPWVATFAIMVFAIVAVILSSGNISMMASISFWHLCCIRIC